MARILNEKFEDLVMQKISSEGAEQRNTTHGWSHTQSPKPRFPKVQTKQEKFKLRNLTVDSYEDTSSQGPH